MDRTENGPWDPYNLVQNTLTAVLVFPLLIGTAGLICGAHVVRAYLLVTLAAAEKFLELSKALFDFLQGA